MTSIQLLEYEYLKHKIAYYEGRPTISDSAFDYIEKQLKEAGSKVIEQVGSKRKDFDFTHPTKMKSLGKMQTEQDKGVTNYQESPFNAWYEKRVQIIGKRVPLEGSPKYDGNAINIIYKGGKHLRTLTRGDGFTGKDITERFKEIIPQDLYLVDKGESNFKNYPLTEEDIIEIRCEVVVNVKIFNEKYSEFANPRNFVAGVIGKDDFNPDAVKDLTIVALNFLKNGTHIPRRHFYNHPLFFDGYHKHFNIEEYKNEIISYEELRKDFEFQLDGVVITFPEEYRELLGENDHDPEWAIAIKFVPDEVITSYVGIEWNVGKTGELAPVILLQPVQLAGTTVKRASGYNAGYLVNNHIGPGAVFSVAKAGDIIPEVQSVVVKSTLPVVLPTNCPDCNSVLSFDGIHLCCDNEDCLGKIAKKLGSAANTIDLKRVGGRTLDPFAKDFRNMFELMKWVLTPGCGDSKLIEQYGIPFKSRSHEIFMDAFKNIRSLTYEQVIIMLGYDNVGRKLSIQIAREHCGLTPDYSGLERALVVMLHEPAIESYIKLAVSELEALGVVIDKPVDKAKKSGTVYVCMTGSPKAFGFKTKEEFIVKFPHLVEVSLTDKECQFLITDSYSSTSSKMGVANKKGITIKTYGDFV
jgi:DNA ligase (NAD+)